MNELEHEWIRLKNQEDQLKKARLEVEAAILDTGINLEIKGTYNHKEMLSITTGLDRKFDQKGLKALHDANTQPFPFKLEFKEDRKLSSALEEMASEFWNTTFEPLLTEKPKKPAFKVR
jgi:hypothetical protein